jgi:hypothetical protein
MTSIHDKHAHDQLCRKKLFRGVCTDEFKAAIGKGRKLADAGKSPNGISKLRGSTLTHFCMEGPHAVP